MKTTSSLTSVLCTLLFASAWPAAADQIDPGEVLRNSGNPVLPSDGLFSNGDVDAVTAYSVLVASMETPVAGLGNHFTGAVSSRVWSDGATGRLAFEYWFSITGNTGPGVFSTAKSATIGGDWTPFAVIDAGSARGGDAGAGVSTAVAGLGGSGWTDGSPLLIARDDLAGFAAPKAYFDLAPFAGTHMARQQQTARFWLATDATSYSTASMVMLDGGLEGQGPVFVPVPEPTTALLLALGFLINRRLARTS